MRYQCLHGRHKYFALFLVFGLTLTHANQQKFEAVRLDGQNYVPLANWAHGLVFFGSSCYAF